MNTALVLTAAGNSTRMGGTVKKEYLTLSNGKEGIISVLSSALYSFLSTKLFNIIVITVPSDGESEARRILLQDSRIEPLLKSCGITLQFIEGGASRQESVKKGLECISATSRDTETVFIHDGARPWVTTDCIRSVLNTVQLHGAAVPAISSVDTQKETDETGKIIRHLDRSRIVSVQTPQGFLFKPLLTAHEKAANDGHSYTDDTEVWGRYAGDVFICPGERENRKITFQGDI